MARHLAWATRDRKRADLEGLGSLGGQAGATSQGKQGSQASKAKQEGIWEGGGPAGKGCEGRCCHTIPLPGSHPLYLIPKWQPLQTDPISDASKLKQDGEMVFNLAADPAIAPSVRCP